MSKKQQRVFWPALIILSIVTSAFVFANTRRSRAIVNLAANAPRLVDTDGTTSPQAGKVKAFTSVMPQGLQRHGPVEVVRFTLYDAGIYPRQARVEKGVVAITIEDLSGGTSGLVVQRVNGNARQSVGTVQRIQNHWRGRQELQLEPGNYEVFMADRPNNKAQLIVQP